MSFIATHKPQALGFVAVPAPGTPVSLVSVLVAAGIMIANDSFLCHGISLWTPPSAAPSGWAGPLNTGTIYIGQPGMNKTTLAGVVATIAPGGFWSPNSQISSNVYGVDKLAIDADHAGDGVYGNADQA